MHRSANWYMLYLYGIITGVAKAEFRVLGLNPLNCKLLEYDRRTTEGKTARTITKQPSVERCLYDVELLKYAKVN